MLKKQLFIIFIALQVTSFIQSSNNSPASTPNSREFFECNDGKVVKASQENEPNDSFTKRLDDFAKDDQKRKTPLNQSQKFTQEDIDRAVAINLAGRPEQFTQKNIDDAVTNAINLKQIVCNAQTQEVIKSHQKQIKRERFLFGTALFTISAYLFSKTNGCKNNVTTPLSEKIISPCKNLIAGLLTKAQASITFLKPSSIQSITSSQK